MRRDLELVGLVFIVFSSENHHCHQQLEQTAAQLHLDPSSERKTSRSKTTAPPRAKDIQSRQRQSQTR